MSRRKNQEPEIEFGMVDVFEEVDNESISDEPVPERECFNMTEARITRVAGGELWININDFGFIITVPQIESWMIKGANVYVTHEGTPGNADFRIVGVQK